MSEDRFDLLTFREFMTKSDREIREKFPELFGIGPWTVRRSNMAFGFEIGSGWRPLLMQTLSKMAEVVKNEKIENFEIVQVKEKYASLRIYTNCCNDSIDKIIDDAETLSETICDVCGEPGTLREINGWQSIKCDTCCEKDSLRSL